MAESGDDLSDLTNRWPWFVDVLFGVTAGLGLEKYADRFLLLWPEGIGAVLASLVIAAGIATFVVYDIAIYHVLVKKFPFTFSKKGFLRLYLDLVMVFFLYLLLAVGLKAEAWWGHVLMIVSGWHVSASLWHILARWETHMREGWWYAILPHYGFILCYWAVAGSAWLIFPANGPTDAAHRDKLLLVLASVVIGAVAWFRWGQVLKRFGETKPQA